MSHSFLIVEDHPLTRSGTRQLLQYAYPGCFCEEISTRAGARRALTARPWSLVLLDLDLPDGNGLDLLPCSSPALVLTMYADSPRQDEAYGMGATAFVSKCEAPERILAAIRASVDDGEHGEPRSETPKPDLSHRECLVLTALLDGRRLAEIAKENGLSPTTLQSYKKRLFRKLGVESVAELARLERDIRI